MKKQILLIVLLSFLSVFSFAQNKKVSGKIVAAMHQQEKSWNNGDIDGYMSYYWNSDSLKFIAKSGVTYGWKPVLDHYKKAYPDTIKMGKLTFSEIRVKKLGCHYLMITGSWKINRAAGNIGGYYSLIWRKIKGKWLIVADHTS